MGDAQLRGQHIGHGVHIRFTGIYGEPDDVKGGLIVAHVHPDGQLCEGGVTFDIPQALKIGGARWTVESWEPLTISPSVLRTDCGLHGWIRGGEWVPA